MNRSPRSNVRRLALARLISVTGGAAAYTALMFTIYQRTRSPVWLSWTLLLTFGVAGLAAPLGGALGDRFDRRRLMAVSDLLGAACFAALTFAHAPSVLVAIAFVAAIVETPFWSASAAAIPNLVEDEKDIGWANGLVQVGANAGIMIGPAIGGALVGAFGPGWVFGANAVSFVVSAVLVLSVRGRFADADRKTDEHRGLHAGFVFLARDRVLRTIALAWTALVLGMGLCMVADIPLATLFHAGSSGYGWMIASWGAGSVAGALTGRFLNEGNERRALVAGVSIIAVSTAAIALSPVFWPILLAIFFAGVGDAATAVAERGIQQRRTPDAVRSRVLAATETVIQLSLTASFAAAGLLLRAVGPRGAYAVGGATAAVGAFVLVPVLRERRREPDVESGAVAQVERAAG